MRMAEAAREILNNNILPFWKGLKDEVNGGFCSYVGFDLKPDPNGEKSNILNSRILWFFSKAALLSKDPEEFEAAAHAYEFLQSAFLDREFGGVFWSVDAAGKPLDTEKHIYSQAFALYGCAAFYQLSGREDVLETAMDLFSLIEEKGRDRKGPLEALDRSWQKKSNEKLSENGVSADRTMNTLLHMIEAYGELYRAAPRPEIREALKELSDLYRNTVFDAKKGSLKVFFDDGYHSLIDLVSYGHEIEASWLVERAVSLLDDTERFEAVSEIGSILLRNVLKDGFDGEAVYNEKERGVIDRHKIWWTQAEAVLGFVNEFMKHDDAEAGEAAVNVLNFIRRSLLDPRPGSEWLYGLADDGSLMRRPIVDPWKCPYHNGRMCLELIRRDPDIEL